MIEAHARRGPSRSPSVVLSGGRQAEPQSSAAVSTQAVWAIVLIFGALLAAVGTALPWVSVTGGLLSVSRTGLELGGGDAVAIAAIAGGMALVGLLALASPSGRWWLLALMGAIVVVALGAADFNEMQQRVDSVESDAAAASVGIGMWAVLGGGIVAGVGALGMRSTRR